MHYAKPFFYSCKFTRTYIPVYLWTAGILHESSQSVAHRSRDTAADHECLNVDWGTFDQKTNKMGEKKNSVFDYFIFKHYLFGLWPCFCYVCFISQSFISINLPLDVRIIINIVQFKLSILVAVEAGMHRQNFGLTTDEHFNLQMWEGFFFFLIPHPPSGASLYVGEIVQHQRQSLLYIQSLYSFIVAINLSSFFFNQNIISCFPLYLPLT